MIDLRCSSKTAIISNGFLLIIDFARVMRLFIQILVQVLWVKVGAILPLQIQGHRFIRPASTENEVFFVKGVDYQPGGSSAFNTYGDSDVLSDPFQCARDMYVFQRLGVNAIRIYQLNPDLNHDECMTMLNNAGIYVILDVNSGNHGEHLNRADPNSTYNSGYLHRIFKFIESFKRYPNVLGFFCGNEVINDDGNYAEINPPFLRAIQRDMKQYISKHSDRAIPVGYAAADNMELRLATFKYLHCNSWDGNSISQELDESRSDFYGLNSYQWCSGSSNWEDSGYEELGQTFSDTTIPLIFSEYGANQISPRIFDEVSEGLYDGLNDIFSGGLVYEFSEEANGYGLVRVDEDNSLRLKQDFENLAYQFSLINLPRIKQSELPDSSVIECDAAEIEAIYKGFGVKNFWIPSQPLEVTSMIERGVDDATSGSIIDGYLNPKKSKYGIKNVNGSLVEALLKWEENNKINTPDKNAQTSKPLPSVTSVSASSIPISTSAITFLTSSSISMPFSVITSRKDNTTNIYSSLGKLTATPCSSDEKFVASMVLRTGGTPAVTESDEEKKGQAVSVHGKISATIKLVALLLLSIV